MNLLSVSMLVSMHILSLTEELVSVIVILDVSLLIMSMCTYQSGGCILGCALGTSTLPTLCIKIIPSYFFTGL